MTDQYAKPLNGLDRYAVVGNPIAHSKSPLIHQAFAIQTGQNLSYERILSPLDGFEETVLKLIEQGYKGVNVTVPFKFEALNFCAKKGMVDRLAATAGAVNTMQFHANGMVQGFNTDGIGLVNDITRNINFDITGKRVLLLGAGGAAFGVLQPLLNANPSLIAICNRTFDKAENAVSVIAKLASVDQNKTDRMAMTFDDLVSFKLEFNLVINSTSVGLTDSTLAIPNAIFAKDCLAYDMMYGRETPFMKQARDNGAQVADGLGMLVEQAAEAFYLWRGVRPETQSVIKQMRKLA